MIKIEQKLIATLKNIISKIENIEELESEEIKILKDLSKNNEHKEYLISHGIEGFEKFITENLEKTIKSDTTGRLYAFFIKDKSLGHPHHKILSFLLEQYDYEKNVFESIHFSKLVKECKIGKNKAKEYLDVLVEKGYVQSHDDGYRVWYSIAEKHLPEEND